MLRSYLAPGAIYYVVSGCVTAALSLDAGWRYALLAPPALAVLAWLHRPRRAVGSRAA